MRRSFRMGRSMRWCLLLLVACTSSMPRQSIDGLMRDYSGDVPGASVLVVREGQVVFRQSYGMANLEERVASTPDTHFRLASLTKQFTAAAILILGERGKLSLDDRATRFLPTLPENGITIRHLLTHTSGLHDYEDLIPPGATKQLKDIDVLHLLEPQRSTYFPPGSRYRYSNSGYVLLGLVVERASGQRFANFLRQSVFEPIGMKSRSRSKRGSPAFRIAPTAIVARGSDGGAPTRASPARRWEMAASTHLSTISS